MEKVARHIYTKTFYMKKTITMLLLLLAVIAGPATAQSKKEIPPPPPPPVPSLVVPDIPPPASLDDFYKTNPLVSKLKLRENKIEISLKNGKKEVYDLGNETEKKNFLEKYELIPAPPPPPPPPVKKED